MSRTTWRKNTGVEIFGGNKLSDQKKSDEKVRQLIGEQRFLFVSTNTKMFSEKKAAGSFYSYLEENAGYNVTFANPSLKDTLDVKIDPKLKRIVLAVDALPYVNYSYSAAEMGNWDSKEIKILGRINFSHIHPISKQNLDQLIRISDAQVINFLKERYK